MIIVFLESFINFLYVGLLPGLTFLSLCCMALFCALVFEHRLLKHGIQEYFICVSCSLAIYFGISHSFLDTTTTYGKLRLSVNVFRRSQVIFL